VSCIECRRPRAARRLTLPGVVCCLSGLLLLGATGCNLASQGQNVDGVRLFNQGNYQAASDRFRQAMESDPTNPDSYYNLAATYHRQGILRNDKTDLDQAESFYDQCLARDPDHVDCYRGLAVLLVERGESDEAFKVLERWEARSPSSAEPKIELARLRQEFGDQEQAKKYLTEALEFDPHNHRALTALGQIREQEGDHQQALAVYSRSLQANRFQPQVATRVAALQRSVGTTAAIVTPPGGTRVVATPGPATR
jgi:tetratricopeptide (TPR) repeat protein